MKKLSSFKRLCVISAAVLILVACAFFNMGYIGGANAETTAEKTVDLFAETALSGLDIRKSEVKAELRGIVDTAKMVSPDTDWTSLESALSGYIAQIDAVDEAAGGVPRVNEIRGIARTELNNIVQFEEYRVDAMTGTKLDYPAGYIGQKYNLVKIYYQDKIRTATSKAEIDGYVNDAQEKYDVITDFEVLRNSALSTITGRQPESAALASYVTLINEVKSAHVERIENITGEPAASVALAGFIAGYEALEPQITTILSDFNTAFNTLVGQLTTYNAFVDAALTTERAVEIVTEVFARAQIQPYALSESIEGALSAMGYTQSVAERAMTIIEAHHDALENLRTVATAEDLTNGQAGITALESTLKTSLGQLKTTALAEEQAIVDNMAEAERVDNLIKALSANSTWDEIKAVRTEYDKLSKTQKGYITQLAKLEELESLKETESPLIMWGVALIIVTVLFLGLLAAFLVIVVKRKKNAKTN